MSEQSQPTKNYWSYLDSSMQDLMQQSFDLVQLEKGRLGEGKGPYHDYAFVVFSAAKAYEGFLKKVFLDMRLISAKQYYGEHFRIGRALSPNLPKRYRSGWVYGKLVNWCGGDELPLEMWDVWRKVRNRNFHFFPHHQQSVTLEEAEEMVGLIEQVMDKTLAGCRLH